MTQASTAAMAKAAGTSPHMQSLQHREGGRHPEVWVVGGNEADGSAVLLRTGDGGLTWQTVHREAEGHWQEAGFTSPPQGVAIHQVTGRPARLLVTRDGGQTWGPVATR